MKRQWIIFTIPDGEIRINLDKVEEITTDRKSDFVKFYFTTERKLKIGLEGTDADIKVTKDAFKKLKNALPNV